MLRHRVWTLIAVFSRCCFQILLQFPEGSRFWPTHHLLHSANYPMYRFYNLDGIRGEPCDILVAHVPPPYAQELENLPLEEVQRRIMIVLHDMFTTRRNGGTARTRQYAESSENFIDSHSGDEIGSEIEISASSGDEADQNDRAVARQRKCAEIRASKKLRKESPTKQEDHSLARAAALRADKDWKKKPVVLPMRIEVTKWGQDPFAQGAYSCSQTTTTHADACCDHSLRPVLIRPCLPVSVCSSDWLQPVDDLSTPTTGAAVVVVRSLWRAVLRGRGYRRTGQSASAWSHGVRSQSRGTDMEENAGQQRGTRRWSRSCCSRRRRR